MIKIPYGGRPDYFLDGITGYETDILILKTYRNAIFQDVWDWRLMEKLWE
jgi:hypothetical protein